ncbi:hypothetical protein HYDPIDRAFT_30967 [Hydnomerulius pinastri MD-312]|uniref:Histone H2A C-terminal domain-containing protein n=1 Tax=Hydnomerulius pinastri MD-312 TaxID=994086 RepID=A0A0C9VUZ5_9AGAM|nr:hypothetical protein HYDPIDRAFT_30967 [Hydnomerulius pinastri MD-312]
MASKAGKSSGAEGKSQLRSAKAGFQFPVGRVHRLLKKGNYAQRVGADAPGMCHYRALSPHLMLMMISLSRCGFGYIFSAEILELAGNAPRDNKKQRIIPRHLQFAVRNDQELSQLLGDVVISQGGVVPFIKPELLPNSLKTSKYWAQQTMLT